MSSPDSLSAFVRRVVGEKNEYAGKAYIGTPCRVSGPVTSIAPADNDASKILVLLDSELPLVAWETFFGPVSWLCVFPVSARESLIAVKGGTRLHVAGKYAGWVKNQGQGDIRMVLADCRARTAMNPPSNSHVGTLGCLTTGCSGRRCAPPLNRSVRRR